MKYFIKARPSMDNQTEITGIVPDVGVIYPSNLLKDKANWLECNGSYVKRSEYPELFARIEHSFGHSKDGYFRLPNLRSRNEHS